MKNATVYAKNRVTVYKQPSTKKEYEYDTVLKGEEVGMATGEIIGNTTGKYWQLVRIGEADYLYAKEENLTYNFLDAQSNVLEEAVIKAKKNKNLPYYIGGGLAFFVIIILILKK